MLVFEGVVGLVAVLEVKLRRLPHRTLGEVDVELVVPVFAVDGFVGYKGRAYKDALVGVGFCEVHPLFFERDEVELDGGTIYERDGVDAIHFRVFVDD